MRGSAGSPTIATSSGRREITFDRGEHVRERGRVGGHRAGRAAAATASAGASYACRRSSAASRSSPLAASEFADGVASSKKSLARTTSCFGVVAGREEAAVVVVVEQARATRRRRYAASASHATSSSSASVQQRFEQRRVVLGVREVRARARSAGSGRRRGAARAAGTARSCGPTSIQSSRSERGGGLGERAEHERVPREQHLVVEPGPHPLRAAGEQRGLQRVDCCGGSRVPVERRGGCCRGTRCAGRRSSRARSRRKYAIDRVGVGAAHLAHLVERPAVELALDAFGVGVFGGEEAAARGGADRAARSRRCLRPRAVARAHRSPGTRAGTRG